MQFQKFKVFHHEGFSTMVLFLIVDVSFGSFQLGPPDTNLIPEGIGQQGACDFCCCRWYGSSGLHRYCPECTPYNIDS